MVNNKVNKCKQIKINIVYVCTDEVERLKVEHGNY